MSLFGSTTTQQKPNLFGSLNTSTSNSTPNLFGSASTTQKPTLSLFGNTTQQSTATTTPSLFGTSNAASSGTNLFGQPKPTLNLFGGNNNTTTSQQPAQAQPAAPSTSLFGSSTLLGGNTLFGGSTQQPTQQNAPAVPSLFGASTNAAAQQPQLGASSSVWQGGQPLAPREKSVPQQMEVLFQKWNPTTPACVFQHYFYNTVGEDKAPFYSPAPGEDESKWEEALKNKPSPGAVPVLAVGPLAVGKRLEIQALWARALQTRLHELNDLLTKILQSHDLKYSVRSQEARRKHLVLSRRCLALATKVQVLRNRGYALDGVEEQLRTKLTELEKTAFDPMLSGRQEEIWAKMSVLRDRAQLLKNETDKLSNDLVGSSKNPLDADQMKKVEKLLAIYENQLKQLRTERENAEKDLTDWLGGK